MKSCPLVLIEWEDSAQPIPAWSYLSTIKLGGIVKCVSVGWLIHDKKDFKSVAPNMGDIDSEDPQVSGVIKIPTICVTKITRLIEAD